MWSRTSLTVLGTLAVIGIAGCAEPKLGAPAGSYTAATFKLKVANADDIVDGAAVTPQFFAAEGVRPLLGRFFTAEDSPPGGYGAAVLSHRYWTEQLRSDPAAIGASLVVDGRQHVIVGVAPPAFQPEGAGLIWIPKKP